MKDSLYDCSSLEQHVMGPRSSETSDVPEIKCVDCENHGDEENNDNCHGYEGDHESDNESRDTETI